MIFLISRWIKNYSIKYLTVQKLASQSFEQFWRYLLVQHSYYSCMFDEWLHNCSASKKSVDGNHYRRRVTEEMMRWKREMDPESEYFNWSEHVLACNDVLHVERLFRRNFTPSVLASRCGQCWRRVRYARRGIGERRPARSLQTRGTPRDSFGRGPRAHRSARRRRGTRSPRSPSKGRSPGEFRVQLWVHSSGSIIDDWCGLILSRSSYTVSTPKLRCRSKFWASVPPTGFWWHTCATSSGATRIEIET